MSEQIQRRLEEVMEMIPSPVSGCWFVHGAETAYYYDEMLRMPCSGGLAQELR